MDRHDRSLGVKEVTHALCLRLTDRQVDMLDSLAKRFGSNRQDVLRNLIVESHERLVERPLREREKREYEEEAWSRVVARAHALEIRGDQELAAKLRTVAQDAVAESRRRFGMTSESGFAQILEDERALEVEARERESSGQKREKRRLDTGRRGLPGGKEEKADRPAIRPPLGRRPERKESVDR